MEQQDFLERRLQNREATGHHRASEMAPALQGVARQLERSIISDNLAQHLYDRDDQFDPRLLWGSNVAPALRSRKLQLERSITRDAVGHLLEGRPEPEDLIKAGIAQPMDRASRIQQMSRKLERSMTQDKIAHLLEKRSDIEALQNTAILKHTTVAPSVQSAQLSLQKNLARSNLYHALKYRPSIVELQEKGYYPELDDDYFQYDGSDCYDEEGQYYEDQSVYEGDDNNYEDDEEDEQEYDQYEEQVDSGYQRRSKNFHLTRILLKFVASMGEAGEVTVEQKGFLKDLIVDQDQTILAVAETFDAENDLHDFKDSLMRLASRC